MKLARALFVAAVIVVIAAAPAGAHALRTASDPTDGATLKQSPTQVVITFTERPDPNLSSIKVLDSTGATKAGNGKPEVVPGQPTQLRIPVSGLGNGVYTVTWRTVSRVDGHLAAGSFSFGVGESPAAGGPAKAAVSKSPRPSTLAVAARWLFAVGVIGLVGAAFVGLVILRDRRPAADRRLLPGAVAAWVLGVVGVIGITEAQRRTAHLALGDLVGSSLWHNFLERGIPVAIAGIGLVLAVRWRRIGLAVAGIGALVAMGGDVATGHPAAARTWTWFRIATQWMHFAAVGIWIGGLAGLLLVLSRLAREERRPVARRYSSLALFGLAVVALTGSLRAIDEVGSWHSLFHTGFGQIVLLKIGLLAVLILLGAINRYRNVPAADSPSGVRHLAGVGGAELAVVAVVLLATAFLQNLAPSATTAAAAATAPKPLAPLVVEANDFATTVKLRLTIKPGTAGFNTFELQVHDYDSGAPITADQVSLRFHYPARTDVGDSTLGLPKVQSGVYSASGGNLSLQGQWTVTAVVQRGVQSVEVPMSVTTQLPPQRVDVARNPGLPDIYTVHLAGNNQLQSYLDPTKPGLNEFHATFIGPDGKELPITDFSASAALGSGPPTQLTTRKLDDLGHYVADAQVQSGRYTFTVFASSADGAQLGATLAIPVP